MKKSWQTMRKKNPKMLYAYVNSKKVVKENIRALNDENGKKVEDPAEIVRILIINSNLFLRLTMVKSRSLVGKKGHMNGGI